MKGTIVTCWLAFGSWLAYGSPLTVRALGGTVVIRQSAESGDASLDSTITIDLDGHRDPQPLKGKYVKQNPLPWLTFLSFRSVFATTQNDPNDFNHIGRTVCHMRLYMWP